MAFIVIPGKNPGVFICPAATKKLLIFYQNGQSAQNAQTIMFDHDQSQMIIPHAAPEGALREIPRKWAEIRENAVIIA